MTANIIWFIVLAAVALVGLRFVFKLFRPFGGIRRTVGGVLLALVSVVVGLVSILGLMGILTIYGSRGTPVQAVTVAGTAEQIARGEILANAGCSGCHSVGGTLPLSGGEELFADIPIPLGKATPANLTPAGRIREWTDGELQRAIREGADPEGNILPVMSANTFRYMSQEDLDAIVAYLRAQPAVETDIPQDNYLSFVAMVMTPLGMMPIKDVPDFGPPPYVEPGATAEYGEYVVKVFDCAICHGDDLGGGPGGILPAGPSLAGAKVWTSDQFITAMRTGVTPAGLTLSEDMPWKDIGKFDDDALKAMLLYIQQVSPS